MPRNTTKILLLTTLVGGVLVSVSSNSWLGAWIGLYYECKGLGHFAEECPAQRKRRGRTRNSPVKWNPSESSQTHLEEAAAMTGTESFCTVKPVILTCLFYFWRVLRRSQKQSSWYKFARTLTWIRRSQDSNNTCRCGVSLNKRPFANRSDFRGFNKSRAPVN